VLSFAPLCIDRTAIIGAGSGPENDSGFAAVDRILKFRLTSVGIMADSLSGIASLSLFLAVT
jgi:hypothetical protein